MDLTELSPAGSYDVISSKAESTVTLDVKRNEEGVEYNPFEHRILPHPTSSDQSYYETDVEIEPVEEEVKKITKAPLKRKTSADKSTSLPKKKPTAGTHKIIKGSASDATPAASTRTIGSFFNLLKSSLGSGLLAMPAAFKHTGLIPGCLGTILVGVMATHCVHILVTTSRDICKLCEKPSLNYTDTCENVFKHGPKRCRSYSVFIRNFVDYAMAGVCLGGTGVYVIFIASSLKDIFDYFYPDYKFQVQIYCGILLLPLILITQVRYLKFLVPFSVLANLCLVFTFAITCWYTFRDVGSSSEVKLAVSIAQWPLFLSTAIFAMEGINVVMPIENEMANPEHFLGCPGVLNVTMVFVGVLYGIVGLFGYMKYGDNVLGSITLNLPQDEILALSAKILVAIAVFFTYCLQMYAPMDIIWIRIQSRFSEKFHNIGQISLRTLSVTLTVILAAAIPDLELLIGLVGAIFFSTLGLLIPIVVQTVHKWDRGLGPLSYILWKNGLILVFYVIVLVSGCYSAISAIVSKFS